MLTLLALLLVANPAPRSPAFELHALGVLGGDTDTNLSSYLLGRPGSTELLLIDGGSVMPGLQRWLEKSGSLAADASPTVRAKASMAALHRLDGFLLTHAHVDHWAGFITDSTLEVGLALQGQPPLPVVGLPETLGAIKTHLLESPLWIDFTAIPPKSPALALAPIAPGQSLALGGFSVSTVLLNHTVPSAGFLVKSGDAVYLHLGDTGPTQAVWDAARPVLQAHRLRAVSIECSFASSDEKLAASSGHLTPRSLLVELGKLAGIPPPKPLAAFTDADALAYAQQLAPSFRDCPVFVIHVKALSYDRVKSEVQALQKTGLNLVLPEQGETYRF